MILGDVIQGQLGDCWFLGALAVVATRMDLIKENCVSAHPEHGFYQFRFYKVYFISKSPFNNSNLFYFIFY
jgi:hypothetical protein